MGYVGIPSAVLFADLPEIAKVYGFQRNSPTSGYKITMLNSGENPLRGDEPSLSELLRRVVEGKNSDAPLIFRTSWSVTRSLLPSRHPSGIQKTSNLIWHLSSMV